MKIFKYLFLITILLPISTFAATYQCPAIENLRFTESWIYGGPITPFNYPALYCWYQDSNSHKHFCLGVPQSPDKKFTPRSSKWKNDICRGSSEGVTPQDCLFNSDENNLRYQSDLGNCKFDQVG